MQRRDRPAETDASQLVDSGRQSGLRALHPDSGTRQAFPTAKRSSLPARWRSCSSSWCGSTRELEPDKRSTPGRHGAGHVYLPRDTRSGAWHHLVDDRRTEVRPAVLVRAVAHRQHADPGRHVCLPPLHGRTVHRVRRRDSSRWSDILSRCPSSACTTACTNGRRG